MIPVPLWHTASVGLEMWLSALAHGARAGVGAGMTGAEAPSTAPPCAAQMDGSRPSDRWATAASTCAC